MKRIRAGDADLVLAGGAEALITPAVLWAWEALRTLADVDPLHPVRSCKPFSRQRSGLVMGEGAAFLVLEPLEGALSRQAHILGELVGYANTTDALHLTRPSVEGQARAMRRALDDARLAPQDIGYINAHGTATDANDATEAEAIRSIFPETVSVSSTKSVHGHWMGAGSAVEALLTLMAVRRRLVPPTAFLDDIDPACALNHVLDEPRALPDLRYAMSNSFAFGGTCGVLIAKAYP
jgi:3-oxoacyl-[acyl-carrier-protein] synthase II